ncbi:FAD-binding oxidoreductase [Piscinibacter gummiphilus]|uniref:Uncharacterized protein n=1 Tax=Piscinibacter gummiphilus TaxID=946333 RepID=A0A1W6L5V3_9BURK|nr:FAD-binding oxidoreductase [Piscinibacter gummiphilus]ARN19634.1 hypothetical protein A4W93_06715 [Piscinibacter gummiphilus]ATU64304.1 CDP-6-deoxy-delta-3,4-glucoseen reductase [Piscinibacter gummiphilus]GLS93503.1 CDP-6-deoxy-delta-3,4-glucoseen reductase [Piscinibacter gummiphilus]
MMAEVFQIRLEPHGAAFECGTNQTILDAAVAAGHWLPHSCRAGSCDTCCLDLVEGAVIHPEGVQLPGGGKCRTCQAHPARDVVLLAPNVPREPGQRVVTAGARVIDVSRPSADVTVVKLQLPSGSGFKFRAGQYADVLMKDGARRSYSMANVPNDEGVIEWHVRRMEGGRFSTHAYDKLKVKDLLRVQGPFGSFMLSDRPAPIVLLASGTGYAPIASMLQAHHAEIAARGAVLYWGGRQWSDLYAVDSIDAWEATFPGVRIVPVLSEPGAGWRGRSGFVHAAVLEDLPDLSMHEVYACGNPLMIDAARAAYVGERGLPSEHFHSDAFVLTNR